MHQEIAIFAGRFNVNVSDAIALPATFERCAQMVGLPVRALISRATYDNALGEYIAKVAREVAASDRENRPANKVAA